MTSLRLASFNLLSGRSLDAERRGRADPEALADAVRTLDADVLALQEVDRHQPRSGGADQAARAAEAMGALGYRYVDVVHGTPGESGWTHGRDGDDDHDGPSFGIALLSRLPVTAWHVLHLDPAPGRYPLPIPSSPPRLLWLPDEPRAVVAAELEGVTVACTHLSFVPGVNVRQLRRARRWLETLPGPRVLLGDLNLPGRMPARLTGWTSLASTPTFPAPSPRLQLDHALVSPGSAVAHASTRAVLLPLSDHRALVTELRLAAPAPGPARGGVS